MKIDKDAHVQARQAQAPNEGMQYTTFHSHPKVLKKQNKIHINNQQRSLSINAG